MRSLYLVLMLFLVGIIDVGYSLAEDEKTETDKPTEESWDVGMTSFEEAGADIKVSETESTLSVKEVIQPRSGRSEQSDLRSGKGKATGRKIKRGSPVPHA